MIYLDASIVLATVLVEVNTDRAAHWLASTNLDDLCSSRWLATEVTSAIGIKVRTGALTPALAMSLLNDFNLQFSPVFTKLEISGQAFDSATNYLRRVDLSLKAGDALHVAVAALGGHSLATFDLKMIRAASAIGAVVEAI